MISSTRKAVIGFLATVGAVVSMAAPALATTSTGDNKDGSFSGDNFGADNHNFWVDWLTTSQNGYNGNALKGYVQTNNLPGTEGDTCMQVAFDWGVPYEHYDVRIIRNCDSNSSRSIPAGFAEDANHGFTAKRIQVAFYDPRTEVLYDKTCRFISDSACGDWNPRGGVDSARIWGRHSDGTNWYQSGGTPTDANG